MTEYIHTKSIQMKQIVSFKLQAVITYLNGIYFLFTLEWTEPYQNLEKENHESNSDHWIEMHHNFCESFHV